MATFTMQPHSSTDTSHANQRQINQINVIPFPTTQSLKYQESWPSTLQHDRKVSSLRTVMEETEPSNEIDSLSFQRPTFHKRTSSSSSASSFSSMSSNDSISPNWSGIVTTPVSPSFNQPKVDRKAFETIVEEEEA